MAANSGKSEFRPGDIVRLKSGGPDVTVSSVGSDGKTIWINWFSGKKLEKENISASALVLASSASRRNATPLAAAARMLFELETNDGLLAQDDAAAMLARELGNEFIVTNKNGNPSIAKAVLDEFAKLTSDTVVWEATERQWRRREVADPAGRKA